MTKPSDTANGLSILAQWKKPVPPDADVNTEVPGGITPYCLYERGEVTFVTASEEPVVPDPAGRDETLDAS